jgi:hypothetical protein
MEEVHENRLGEQEKADSRSGAAVTTEETHQVTWTMARARTQPSKAVFENRHPQRNELTVLKLEEEQRVIVKSRATGQAETSWGEEVAREESSTKKHKIEETTQGANTTAGSAEDTGYDPEEGETTIEQDEEGRKLTGKMQRRRRHSGRRDWKSIQVKAGPSPQSTRSSKQHN